MKKMDAAEARTKAQEVLAGPMAQVMRGYDPDEMARDARAILAYRDMTMTGYQVSTILGIPETELDAYISEMSLFAAAAKYLLVVDPEKRLEFVESMHGLPIPLLLRRSRRVGRYV